MAVEPQGILSVVMDHLRTLLASCTAFQTWVSAVDVAGAKEHVVLFGETQENISYPCAVIIFDAGCELRSQRTFTTISEYGGGLAVMFTKEVPATYSDDFSEGLLDFANDVGQILEEVDELAGQDSYLNVVGWSMNGPARSEKREKEDLAQCRVQVEWATC